MIKISHRDVEASYGELKHAYLPALENMFYETFDRIREDVISLGGKHDHQMSPEEVEKIKNLKIKIKKIYDTMREK